MKRLQELLEEYKQADKKRRSDMWLMFIDLRDRFDQVECRAKNTYPKFVVDLCHPWCQDWKVLS